MILNFMIVNINKTNHFYLRGTFKCRQQIPWIFLFSFVYIGGWVNQSRKKGYSNTPRCTSNMITMVTYHQMKDRECTLLDGISRLNRMKIVRMKNCTQPKWKTVKSIKWWITCRWLFTWYIVSPGTLIILRTPFGVAPKKYEELQNKHKEAILKASWQKCMINCELI
jgi:hypothetical protein